MGLQLHWVSVMEMSSPLSFIFMCGRWSEIKGEPLDATPCLKAAEWETWDKGLKCVSIKSSHSLCEVSNVLLNIPNTPATAPKRNADNSKDSNFKGIGKIQMVVKSAKMLYCYWVMLSQAR